MTHEIRSHAETLLRRGDREAAVRFLQDALRISRADAQRLTAALETEVRPNPTAAHGPHRAAEIFRRAGAFGCLPLLARATATFFTIGAVMLLMGASLVYMFQSQNIERSDRVPGTVTALDYSPEGAAPVIEYTWNGDNLSYKSDHYDEPPSFYAGQTVWLYVHRESGEVIPDTYEGRWAVIVGFLIMALVAAVLAVVCRRFARRKF